MSEKILGVGFHKTGTTSLGSALKILGYSWQGWNTRISLDFHDGKIENLLTRSDDVDCFEDFPWPLLYKEIHARHSNVRFILTKRSTTDVWLQSLIKHCDRVPPKPSDFRRYLYGVDHPRENPDHVKAVHQRHIDDIRSYAQQHSVPLLEMCFEQGDGWTELCSFLNKPVPQMPFPLENQRPKPETRTK